jgi:hypothetical protein
MNVRIAVLAAALGFIACAPTKTVVESIGSAIDCNGICSRYETCFDSKYDTSACASRCREAAGKDADYRRKADKCYGCLNDKACAQATFSCALECSAVVP